MTLWKTSIIFIWRYNLTFLIVFQNLDETLIERLEGLTEMFPESVRRGAYTAFRGIGGVAKWLYNFTGRTIWILSTSFVLLAVPIIVEVERGHAAEMQLRQQRQVSSLRVLFYYWQSTDSWKFSSCCIANWHHMLISCPFCLLTNSTWRLKAKESSVWL